MKKVILSTLVMGLMLGCSSTQSLSKAEKNMAYDKFVGEQSIASIDKITSFKFTGWKSLTDDYLIVTALRKKDYLLELNGGCAGLRFSNAIKLNQASSSSLDKFGDSISAVGESALATNCYIKSIHPLTQEQSQHIVSIGKNMDAQS